MKSIFLGSLIIISSAAAFASTSITKEDVKAAADVSSQIKQVVEVLKTQDKCSFNDSDITLSKTRFTIQVNCENGFNTEDMQFIVFKGKAYRNGEKVELDLTSIRLHYLNN